MSKYTTELRYIIASKTTAEDGASIPEKIQGACASIFNFPFPIWEESYRETLEYKILQHYYMREIGFETVPMFQFYLMRRLQEIMPYYNALYTTTQEQFDILDPTYLIETVTREHTGTHTNENKSNHTSSNEDTGTNHSITNTTFDEKRNGTTTQESQNTTINSDLPQATIQANADYATTSTETNDTTNTTTSETANGTNNVTTDGNTSNQSNSTTNTTGSDTGNETFNETTTLNRKGNQSGKTPVELINEFREAILNIDLMIINDLQDLFFGLW